MAEPRLLIADTETTGFGNRDRVCELAFIEVDTNLMVLHTYESLINPRVPISPAASACNGLTAEMLALAPPMDAVLEEAPGEFNNVLLIAHNAPFDARMLRNDWGITKMFDTLKAARNLYPGLTSHKLGAIKGSLGWESRGEAHTALADTWDVYELVRRMMVDTGLTLLDLIEDAHMPQEVKFMPWGKHKGVALPDLPKGYASWLLKQDLETDLRVALERVAK